VANLPETAKKLIFWIVPLLLFCLVYWGQTRFAQIPTIVVEYLPTTTYVLVAITAAVGWFFHRHRIALAMIMTALALWLTSYSSHVFFDPKWHYIVAQTVAILLPLNLAAIAWLPDGRTLLSFWHVVVLLCTAIQFALVYSLIAYFPSEYRQFLLFSQGTILDITPSIKLVFPAVASSLVALLAVLVRAIRQSTLIDLGLFWLLLSGVLAMNTLGAPPYFSVLMIVGILSLAVSLLQTWYNLAYLDQLTGLPGRLALNELTKTLKGSYVAAMVDVDHFKKFNDTYGHDVGDQILKLVASKLRQVTGGGAAFRYGGEEFTVVFPGKRVKDVFAHLSTLREAIEETHMILRNKSRPTSKPDPVPTRRQPLRYLNVTVSIGIAEANEELAAPAAVLKAADEALYRAKERGRNRLSL
jgi:diguanylate cyclase (GGDEF)-like protein